MATSKKGDILLANILRTDEARAYNDLLGAPGQSAAPASSAPTWSDDDFGLGGNDFRVLKFDTNEYQFFWFQTHHGVVLASAIELHIHWMIGADDTGNEFAWEADVIGAPIGGSWSHLGTFTSDDYVLQAGDSAKHHYFEINGDIGGGFNTTVSSVFCVRLKRVEPATGTDSTQNIGVLWVDCHVLLDEIGSNEEASKS